MPNLPAIALAALAALALAACAKDAPPSPAAAAMPHGATSVTDGNLSGFGPGEGPRGPSSPLQNNCPEADPAQPNCRVPR